MEDNPSTSRGCIKGKLVSGKHAVVYHSVIITVKETQSFHFIKCQKVKKLRESGSES